MPDQSMVRPGRIGFELRPEARRHRPPGRHRDEQFDACPWRKQYWPSTSKSIFWGTVAPGATIKVELQSDRNLSGYLKDKQSNYLSDRFYEYRRSN